MHVGSFMRFRCRILVIFVNYLWNLLEWDRELYFKSPINICSPVNIQMDPPQIATEGFSSDSSSEMSPEQHTKNRRKSRRANIIFFGKIQNGGQKHNFVYYSVI